MDNRKDTVDLTPSWRGIVPGLVQVAVNGDNQTARTIAMDELLRLADYADAHLAKASDHKQESATKQDPINWAPVTRSQETIFIPLPRAVWRSAGRCDCSYCKGQEGFWDTAAIARDPEPGKRDYVHTVHYPELQARKTTYAPMRKSK